MFVGYLFLQFLQRSVAFEVSWVNSRLRSGTCLAGCAWGCARAKRKEQDVQTSTTILFAELPFQYLRMYFVRRHVSSVRPRRVVLCASGVP